MQINANTLRIYSTRVRRLTTKGIYCKAKYLAAVLDSHEHRAEYALDLEKAFIADGCYYVLVEQLLANQSTRKVDNIQSGDTISTRMSSSEETSNIHESYALMSTLLYPSIPIQYIEACLQILQKRHIETVFEERAVQLLCALPSCAQRIQKSEKKYRVSLSQKSIYDATIENQFCSLQCYKKSQIILSKANSRPPQLCPSLTQVFGTTEPDPFTWNGRDSLERGLTQDKKLSQKNAIIEVNKKCVWSKSSDMNVTERPDYKQSCINSSNVEANITNFPTASQAVLIEGYMFPAHKEKIARKVQDKLRKLETQKATDRDFSDGNDMFESDADSLCSSYASSDEETELITSDELSKFIDMWRMFASWVTRRTRRLIAGDQETVEEDMSHQKMQAERRGAFDAMLARTLPALQKPLGVIISVYMRKHINSLVQTFHFPDAVSAGDFAKWRCIAAILVAVAIKGRGNTPLSANLNDAILVATGMDANELEKIFSLFYDREADESIVMAPINLQAIDKDQVPKRTENAEKICRRCRRKKNKCCCTQKGDITNQEYSVDELNEMMSQAMKMTELLRDQ